MFFEGKTIVIQHVHMQQQSGSSDCGLFALATAAAICNGLNPGSLEFQQRLMREHLRKSLQRKKLLPFPFKEVPRRIPEFVLKDRLRIYCVCRQLGGKWWNVQTVETGPTVIVLKYQMKH